MKTILIFVGFFDENNLTALPRYAYELTTRSSKKYKFIIFTNGKENKEYNIAENVTVRKISGSTYNTFKQIKQYIKKHNIDLIHFFGSLIGAMILLNKLSDTDKQIIINLFNKKTEIHDFLNLKYIDFMYAPSRTLYLPSLKTMFLPDSIIRHFLSSRNLAQIIVPSKRMYIYYKTMLPDKEVIQLPAGIDAPISSLSLDTKEKNLFDINKSDKVILYLGHAYLTRGVDDLIASFIKIKQYMKDIKLILVLNNKWVQNSSYDLIKKQIKDEDNIILIDKHIENPFYFYNISSVVVLPYRFSEEIPEYPFVLLEAMFCEKPVITTRIGAIPEIIEDRSS